jgi:hypothetical protein
VKPRTAIKYRHELDEYILPAFGDRDFESVTRAEVQALHASLRHIPSTANYVVNVVGSLYKRIITDAAHAREREQLQGPHARRLEVALAARRDVQARGLGPVSSPPLGALTIAASMEVQSHAMPNFWS